MGYKKEMFLILIGMNQHTDLQNLTSLYSSLQK